MNLDFKKRLYESIMETDSLVFINVQNSFPELSSEIQAIQSACKSLWGEKFSLFLSGSLSFCSRTASFEKISLEDKKSDVDMWIIVDSEPKRDSTFKEYLLAYDKLHEFDLAAILMVSEYAMSIKIMLKDTFSELAGMHRNILCVHRRKSILLKKDHDTFYSLSRSYVRLIKEEKVSDGYKWHWDGTPFVNQDFVLTDLHSFILFGSFIYDGISANRIKDTFIKNWLLYMPQSVNFANHTNLFKYYEDKSPLALAQLMHKKAEQTVTPLQ